MASPVRYCTHCGSTMETRVSEGNLRLRCPGCRSVVYENPKLVACGVVLRKDHVLFVQRAAEPGRGLWSLPAGYVNRGETVEDGAVRELLEETGLQVRVLGLVGVFSEREDPVVLVAYVIELTGGGLAPHRHEALDARWFPVQTLPQLAFARDARIVARSVERVNARLG